MGEVVGFKRDDPPELVYECLCGCQAFYVKLTHVECVECGEEICLEEIYGDP